MFESVRNLKVRGRPVSSESVLEPCEPCVAGCLDMVRGVRLTDRQARILFTFFSTSPHAAIPSFASEGQDHVRKTLHGRSRHQEILHGAFAQRAASLVGALQ